MFSFPKYYRNTVNFCVGAHCASSNTGAFQQVWVWPWTKFRTRPRGKAPKAKSLHTAFRARTTKVSILCAQFLIPQSFPPTLFKCYYQVWGDSLLSDPILIPQPELQAFSINNYYQVIHVTMFIERFYHPLEDLKSICHHDKVFDKF